MSYTQTIAPRLPLANDNRMGYKMNVTMRQAISQNLKCLMLTAPGERIMDPSFGVGMNKYVFSNEGSELTKNIKVNIRQQVSKYMPFVSIQSVEVQSGDTIAALADSKEMNKITVVIRYVVQSIGISDVLDLSLRQY